MIEILSPPKIEGKALGSRILKKVAVAPSPIERARWIFSGSMDASPTTVLMTIGKNAMRNAISTFGSRPNPNQTRSSGATATFGMACDETRSGSTERENAGHMKMASASGTPTTMLSRYPNTISIVVTQPCLRSRPACSANETTILLGAGRR